MNDNHAMGGLYRVQEEYLSVCGIRGTTQQLILRKGVGLEAFVIARAETQETRGEGGPPVSRKEVEMPPTRRGAGLKIRGRRKGRGLRFLGHQKNRGGGTVQR